MSTVSNLWHAEQPFTMAKALLSISSAGRSQLVKMLLTVYVDQHVHTYTF